MSQGVGVEIMTQTSEKFSLPSSSDEDEVIVVKRKKKLKMKSSPSRKESESDIEAKVDNASTDKKKKSRRIQLEDSDSDEDLAFNDNYADSAKLSLSSNNEVTDSCIVDASQINKTDDSAESDIESTKSDDIAKGDADDLESDVESTKNDESEINEKDDVSAENTNEIEKPENLPKSDSESDSGSSSEDDDTPPLRLFRNKNPTAVNESRRINSEENDLFDDERDEDEDDIRPDPSEIAEPRISKPKSNRRNTMMELHSETQRLVRESSINLPYHRPEPKKLSEFMKRPVLGKPVDETQKSKAAKFVEDIGANVVDDLPDIGENTEDNVKLKTPTDAENVSLAQSQEIFSTEGHGGVSAPNSEQPTISESENNESSNVQATQPMPAPLSRPLTRRERLLQQIGSKLPQLQPKKPEISPNKFIDLDDDTSKKQHNAGVNSLMERFMKHSKAGRRRNIDKKRKVELNIVKKVERADGTGVELVSEVVTATVGTEDDQDKDDLSAVKNAETGGTPGQRLQLLRQQLAEKMKKRREVERKKREELHKLDNEDIDQSEEEEEDCDWSEGESDEEEMESGKEEDKPIKEKEKRGNGVIESSDESEDEDTEPMEDGNSKLSAQHNDTSLPRLMNEGSVMLFEDSTRSSASTLNKSDRMTPALDRTCSDDSFYGSMIPLHQPEVSNISNSSHFNRPQLSRQGEFDDTCFESDSRSLSQPFRLDFEASQSQYLDADGFIKESSISKPAAKRSLLPPGAEDDNAMTDCNMSQLLNLCSAPFDSPKTQKKPGISRLMNTENDSAVNDTQDLIGLCTGNFTDSIEPLDNSDLPVDDTQSVADDATDKDNCDVTNNDDDSRDLFKSTNVDVDESFGFNILSGNPTKSQPDPTTQFSDQEKSDDDDDDDQPMLIVRKKKFTREKIAREFLENEAELSGSDEGSGDEDDDAGPDEYEIEEPVEELPEEEEIARQLNRVHRRQQQEDDQRNIELLQEALLGGEEIAERERKFRWKNIDSSMTEDILKSDDEDGDHPENPLLEGPEDSQWMRERLEREEFLQNNEVSGLHSEDSRLMNLGRTVVLSRQNSLAAPSPTTTSMDTHSNSSNQTSNKMRNGRLSVDESSCSRDSFKNKGHRGSFLSRSQDVLTKLASLQGIKNVNGPKHSDKMLFKVKSPKANKRTKRKQLSEISNNNSKSSSAVKEPPRKRTKVIDINEDSNSVFDLM